MAISNKRIYYAVHQVGFRPDGSTGSYTALHGGQSVGITTNFNLVQTFQLGQQALYDNREQIPNIEVTLEKVMDGYAPIYLLATQGAVGATLGGRSNARTVLGLSIFPDTQTSASGTPGSHVQVSGLYVSNLQYRFPVDGTFTEAVTLVGNNIVWAPTSPATLAGFVGAFLDNADTPLAAAGSGGVNRRENLVVLPTGVADGTDVNGAINDARVSVFPQDIFGISTSGTLNRVAGDFQVSFQNINVSVDLGRTELFQLGRRGPFHRYVQFPTEVTCEFEVLSASGNMVSATENGINAGNGICPVGTNLSNRTIRLVTCEGTRIDLGTKNKLASTNYTGGDTGGSNVTTTYRYSNFNDLTVVHPQDPTTALRPSLT